MKVIKFPRIDEQTVVKVTGAPQPKLYIGSFSITCPCGSISHLDPQNMIFKSMEFYCSKCGHAHKVSNPAFSSVTPPRQNR